MESCLQALCGVVVLGIVINVVAAIVGDSSNSSGTRATARSTCMPTPRARVCATPNTTMATNRSSGDQSDAASDANAEPASDLCHLRRRADPSVSPRHVASDRRPAPVYAQPVRTRQRPRRVRRIAGDPGDSANSRRSAIGSKTQCAPYADTKAKLNSFCEVFKAVAEKLAQTIRYRHMDASLSVCLRRLTRTRNAIALTAQPELSPIC